MSSLSHHYDLPLLQPQNKPSHPNMPINTYIHKCTFDSVHRGVHTHASGLEDGPTLTRSVRTGCDSRYRNRTFPDRTNSRTTLMLSTFNARTEHITLLIVSSCRSDLKNVQTATVCHHRRTSSPPSPFVKRNHT